MAIEVNEVAPPVLHELLDEAFRRLSQEISDLTDLPEDELVELPIWVEGLIEAPPSAFLLTLHYTVLKEEGEERRKACGA